MGIVSFDKSGEDSARDRLTGQDLLESVPLLQSIQTSPIAKELGLAEKLAMELRRPSRAGAQEPDSPPIDELVQSMELHLCQVLDDHAMRLQSLSRQQSHLVNTICQRMSRKINILAGVCVVQALCTAAILLR